MDDSHKEGLQSRTRTDVLRVWHARAMLGLLDRDPKTICAGDPLPLGWHWLCFHDAVRSSELAPDGHEERGKFMPAIDLPRRMWAGGHLRQLRPVVLGEPATLMSKVKDVKEKEGKSGRLVFITVAHTLTQLSGPCVEEDQVIVYREAEPRGGGRMARRRPAPAAPAAPTPAPLRPPIWRETFLPTPVTLFQFSALTYNAHRIHYDHPYATEQEGYPGLLVHGPLTALLLLDAAQRNMSAPIRSFRYRAMAPLFAGQPITLVGRGADGVASAGGNGATVAKIVEALDPAGAVAMRGWVELTNIIGQPGVTPLMDTPLMDANDHVDAVIADILTHEGGYVCDPDDPGSHTNFGVTIATLSAWRGRPVEPEEVRNLTRAEAVEIYRERYWSQPRISRLPRHLWGPVVDMAVHSGANRAIRLLQRVLGVGDDGVIGPVTCAAASEADPHQTVREFCTRRVDYLFGLADRRPSSRKYCRTRRGGKGGWIRRTERFVAPEDRLSEAEFAQRCSAWKE